ncbi:NAD(P)/FAD-dependent oxidoreductase [Xanthobacter tagetidis]|uniref:FAD-binding oxidoreductase n=1 Tax=Xanthobacter tagetidis TaxID=60216 RepID=A0A3L7AEC4_9HYPH|nr:FAD-dependent oxidoreductase [Xanthobacter tagetidis]MBB6306080.1 D-amino-acid dehydrogenase [Xanthobacter tagetidis]RLP77742.1 FAD-binding oxidoreductase [Xanthobacter tagetidis]
MRVDVAVLGAGIVGVSTALHLQARGMDVVLLDRGPPGEGASFGNAGLIERSSVIPTAFPRQARALARYALNRVPSVRYDPLYLLRNAPTLVRYWQQSSRANLRLAIAAMLPLIEASVDEHKALIAQAGAADLVRSDGWIGIWRTPQTFATIAQAVQRLDRFGLAYSVLDAAEIARVEPALRVGPGGAAGGLHWHDPLTITDPGALVQRYADLFVRRGGRLLVGDAERLRPAAGRWSVAVEGEQIEARQAVIALGAQSSRLAARFGHRVPILMKRGYHRHFAMGDAMPTHAVADQEQGFVMSPMARGLRLTTGVEFAPPEAPANLRQIRAAEVAARQLLPLGAPVEATSWLGIRPCPPDMRPVIGPAPGAEGLWFNFGHAHHGLTIGPATGRLLAQMLAGETPFADPAPYRADRF